MTDAFDSLRDQSVDRMIRNQKNSRQLSLEDPVALDEIKNFQFYSILKGFYDH